MGFFLAMTGFRDIEQRSLYLISHMMNQLCSLALGLGAAACLFAPRVSASALPATVSFGNLVQTYDGTPKAPSFTTVPSELPVQVVYRNLSPTAPIPRIFGT